KLVPAPIERVRLRFVDARTGGEGTVVPKGTEMVTVDSDDEVAHTHTRMACVRVGCDVRHEQLVGLLHPDGHPHAERTDLHRERDKGKVADERGHAEVHPPRDG